MKRTWDPVANALVPLLAAGLVAGCVVVPAALVTIAGGGVAGGVTYASNETVRTGVDNFAVSVRRGIARGLLGKPDLATVPS